MEDTNCKIQLQTTHTHTQKESRTYGKESFHRTESMINQMALNLPLYGYLTANYISKLKATKTLRNGLMVL